MEKRSHNFVLIAIFGGATLLLFAALWPTVNPSASVSYLAVLWLATALLFFIGFYSRYVLNEDARKLQDETDREHELEAELEQQKHAIDTLAEGLNIGIFVCDSKARVLYANPKAIELFKFEFPVNRTLLDVTISYDLEQMLLRAVTTDEHLEGEFTTTYPEDRILVAEAWPDRLSGRAFLSVYDMTELRRLERIRKDFVANVSHELRTPLSTIRAMAETLLDDKGENAELSERYLNKIVSEIDRLSNISQDLLILSSAESNQVRPQECDVADIVRSVTQQLRHKSDGKCLELSYNGPESLLIRANPTQVTQIAINLIDNAINYTQDGSVSISVKQDDTWAEIRVEDTGIGIPSDQIDRVFERFYRVDKGRSRMTGGTGLGLSIVKHIVDAHGGTVTVSSDLGKGTEFVVRLPEVLEPA